MKLTYIHVLILAIANYLLYFIASMLDPLFGLIIAMTIACLVGYYNKPKNLVDAIVPPSIFGVVTTLIFFILSMLTPSSGGLGEGLFFVINVVLIIVTTISCFAGSLYNIVKIGDKQEKMIKFIVDIIFSIGTIGLGGLIAAGLIFMIINYYFGSVVCSVLLVVMILIILVIVHRKYKTYFEES